MTSCSSTLKCGTFVFTDDGLTPSFWKNPDNLIVYEREIVPWLSGKGIEMNELNLETINGRTNFVKDFPIFNDRKFLFELCELLLSNELSQLGDELLKFIRSHLFFSSTYTILIESFRSEKFSMLNRILSIWFPRKTELFLAINNMVELRMGEDILTDFIELYWDFLCKDSREDFIYSNFAIIFLSAMKNWYVSLFEEILDKLPNMISFINPRLNSYVFEGFFGKGRSTPFSSLINEFCYYLSQHCPNYSPQDSPLNSYFSQFDHNVRPFSSAIYDLINLMINYGENIDGRDSSGMAPIHLAISLNNHQLLKVLLECGANYKLLHLNYSVEALLESTGNEKCKEVFNEFLREKKERSQARISERQGIRDTWKSSK